MLSSSSIAVKASLLLQDTTNVRWSVQEMAKWINAGCRELVLLKPTALAANVAMLLSAGTKQDLLGASFKSTTDGAAVTLSPIQLLDVVRNLGSTGTEANAGTVVIGLDRKILDATLPGWHAMPTQPNNPEVLHFMADPRDPKVFYVYPKATASPAMYVEIVVSRSPVNTLSDEATALGDNDIDAGIDDIYESVLVDYVLYRAYSKDSEHTANAGLSQWHYKAFQAGLGVQLQNEVALAPRQQFSNGRPPAEGQRQQG
jgi:hypothetical protein